MLFGCELISQLFTHWDVFLFLSNKLMQCSALFDKSDKCVYHFVKMSIGMNMACVAAHLIIF